MSANVSSRDIKSNIRQPLFDEAYSYLSEPKLKEKPTAAVDVDSEGESNENWKPLEDCADENEKASGAEAEAEPKEKG